MKKTIIAVLLGTVSIINLTAGTTRPQLIRNNLPAPWKAVSPQTRLKALRVAQLDAYRALLERVYGFQLESGSTVYDYMLESDRIRNTVDHILKGHAEIEKPEFSDNSIVTVTYGIKLGEIVETIITEKSFNKTTKSKILSQKNKLIEASGYGALPDSPGIKMLRAKRAAELDAFRLMAERFAGVKVNAQTTVADLCLKNDKIKAASVAYLKGLKPVAITYDEDYTCTVKLQLKVRETIKTIKKLVTTFADGTTEKLSDTDISTNDKIFTVEGHGAPDTVIPRSSVNNVYEQATIIYSKVVNEIVTE